MLKSVFENIRLGNNVVCSLLYHLVNLKPQYVLELVVLKI
jgi:hypothetical protein